MRFAPRIYLPALAAVLLTAGIGLTFFWQIRASIRAIERSLPAIREAGMGLLEPFRQTADPDIDLVMQAEALALLRKGEILELKGQWREAQEQFQLSVDKGGGTFALKKLLGLQMQRREWSGAEQTLGKLKKQGRRSDETMLMEGLLSLKQGKKDAAAKLFAQNKDKPQGAYGLALIAILDGNHLAAQEHLQREAEGSDQALRSYASTILSAYQEFSLFPDGQEIHLQTLIARALAQVNECEIGLKLLQSVIAAQDKYRDALIVKGYCELLTDRVHESVASLERAYAIDPEKPETQYFLARAYKSSGDTGNALMFLQYAIENGFTPERDARELLATYALEVKDVKLALAQYQALIDQPNSDASLFDQYITIALSEPGHESDAYKAGKEAVKKWPDDPSVLTLFAKSAIAAGKTSEAENALRTALKIDPKYSKASKELDKLAKQSK